MSVPAWKRGTSQTDFLRYLMELNIRLGKIVGNKPKKYKQNYGDHLIKTALSALKHAEVANSIYISSSISPEDFAIRRGNFETARGEVDHLATAAYIFLEICKESHETSIQKVMKEEEYIGSMCEDISKSLSGVLKSDKRRISK